MWKMTFKIFIKSLRFETPWVRKTGFYESFNQLYPTKIEETRPFFVFLKK